MAVAAEQGGPTRALRRWGVFNDLAVVMVGLGAAIGLAFPLFAVLLGVPAVHVLRPRFWAACLLAGFVLAAGNWLVAQHVLGRRLRALCHHLTQVAEQLRHASARGDDAGRVRSAGTLPVTTSDELGRLAGSFNALLLAVHDEHRFRSLVRDGSDLTCLVDAADRVVFVSSSVRALLGWTPEQVRGRPLHELVHPEDVARLTGLPGLDGAVASGPGLVVVRVDAADGSTRKLEVTSSDRRHDPAVGALVLTARDVTERQELEARLTHQALHDDLTGLANRTALQQHGCRLLADTAACGAPLAVLVLDLNRFKEINDTLGHACGDQLLQQVARRLAARLREQDLLTRLGGDEFAVLLPGLDAGSAPAAAHRLLESFADSFHVDGLDLDVDVSIGVALHQPAPGGPPAEPPAELLGGLLREADIAMYAAKQMQTGVELYAPGTDTHNLGRLLLLTELRRAVDDGDQLVLHFQPKVDLTSGDVVGVEALVRWQHPSRGLLPPNEFLPAAERSGLIHALTDAVLDQALRQARDWLLAGVAVPVAVNLSARSLHLLELPERVVEALQRHGVPAALLRLEVTESALMDDPDRALTTLSRLREVGVGISLDDFGTGYSSMSYLKRMPVDELKVDRSFVIDLTGSPEDAALVRAAIHLGHTMGMTVVAEGVEAEDVAMALRGMRCDVGQGYHFSRPLEGPAMTALLQCQVEQPARRATVAPVGG